MKAVIFDMDGLMIDSEVVSYAVYKDLLSKYGVDLSLSQYGLCFAGKTMTNGLLYARDYFNLDFNIDDAESFCFV